MTTKRTPGPWEVAYQDKNGQSVVKGEHIEVATCWHHCVGSIEKEMEANARLIAAAPDLLEALHAMLSYTAMLDPSQGFDGFDHSAVNQALAAITKAEAV